MAYSFFKSYNLKVDRAGLIMKKKIDVAKALLVLCDKAKNIKSWFLCFVEV